MAARTGLRQASYTRRCWSWRAFSSMACTLFTVRWPSWRCPHRASGVTPPISQVYLLPSRRQGQGRQASWPGRPLSALQDQNESAGTEGTRSTIEVASFRYFVCEKRVSLTPYRRNANLDFEKTICRLGPRDHSPRCNLIFAGVSFRVRYKLLK